MVNVVPIKRVTITEQVMEQIAQWITSGELSEGDKLPNERELAEKFGVNRGRIRESLRALSIIGLITIKPGEGSYVNKQEAPIPSETIIWMYHNERNNLEEIYAARKLIESEVYLTTYKKLEEKQIQQLELILEELKRISKGTGDHCEKFQDLLDKFDLLMGEWSENKIYYKLIQTIIHLRRESMVKLLFLPGASENSRKMRTELVKAMKEKDDTKVKQAIDHCFNSAKKFYDLVNETK